MKTTATTQPIAGPMPHTPEWYAAHKDIITATDIAPILGRSDYKTALDVYAEKKGLVAPFEGNEHTRRGQRYEPVILADYASKMQCMVRSPLPLYYHPRQIYFGATPDASVAATDDYDERGVEAKLTMSPARAAGLGEENTDFVPDDWMLQCQSQMAVMGWGRVDMAVLLFGRLKIYTTTREPDLIQIIQSAAKEFWERLQNDDPPEPQWEHSATPKLIKAIYGVREGTEVLLSQETENYWLHYRDLGTEIKRLESERETAKTRVLAAMGEAEIGILPEPGIELIRQTVRRGEYTVKPTEYVQLKQRKAR